MKCRLGLADFVTVRHPGQRIGDDSHENCFRSHADRTGDGRFCFCLRPGIRRRIPAQRVLGLGFGQRLRGRCRGSRGRQHAVVQPCRHVAPAHQTTCGRAACDHAVDEIQQRGLGRRQSAIAGRRRRRRRRAELRAQPLFFDANQPGLVVRRRLHRALGLGHRLRRRLGRPIPGGQVQHQDHEPQSGGVVEGGEQLRARARAERAANRR